MSEDLAKDDDDWEYEYDDQSTESICLTVDLDSFVSFRPASKPTKARRNRRKKHRPTEDEDVAAAEEVASTRAGTDEPTVTPAIGRSIDGNDAMADEDSEDDVEADEKAILPGARRVQFHDLGSESPIIMVDTEVYSCRWASALGTDLIFKPNEHAVPYKPDASAILTNPRFDVVAATPLRLVAHPTQIIPRNPKDDVADREPSAVPAAAPATTVSKPNFVSRFAALKVSLGEHDKIVKGPQSTRAKRKRTAAVSNNQDQSQSQELGRGQEQAADGIETPSPAPVKRRRRLRADYLSNVLRTPKNHVFPEIPVKIPSSSYGRQQTATREASSGPSLGETPQPSATKKTSTNGSDAQKSPSEKPGTKSPPTDHTPASWPRD